MTEPRVTEPRVTETGGNEAGVTVAVVTGAGGSLGRAMTRRPAGGAFPTAAEQIYDDPAAYNQHVPDQQSLTRRGTPGELAAVVSFLAGPDASNASGQTIEVNGGWVMS